MAKKPKRGKADQLAPKRKKRTANSSPAGGGGGSWKYPTVYKRKAAAEQRTGHAMTLAEFRASRFWTEPPPDSFSQAGGAKRRAAQANGHGNDAGLALGGLSVPKQLAAGDTSEADATAQTGTSIFDPVLSELAYRWFCPPGGTVLDPFAGGSVRGIVAAKLGRNYLGIDLREEQLVANRAQAEAILGEGDGSAEWIAGDARVVLGDMVGAGELHDPFDFVFSCPPYGNLEVYSDDPLDLSAMPDEEFDEAYAEIIGNACALLKPDRFACFVVGDYRDASGYYRSLPAITARAFEAAGCRLYNDAILLTAVGSLPVRARKQFEVSRKLGKTHQNILVFCNGDPKKAAAAVGPVEFGEGVDVFANGEPPGAEAGRGVEDAAGPPVGVVLPAPPAATIERVAATQLGGEV